MRLFPTILLFALTLGQMAQARSVALVIGNDTYQYLPPLEVAVSDANAHCDHLRNVRQFDSVQCLTNATKNDMDQAVFEFLRQLNPGDTAMVVFSGHGVQLDRNDPESVFLIPTDMDGARIDPDLAEFSLRRNAVQFHEIRASVRQRQARLSVFVLDNCRDNPLAQTRNRAVAMSRGLGRVQADRGEFIFFSAAEGEVAFDKVNDTDSNSPFTSAFLAAFQPNVPLTTVANEVETAVLRTTREAGLPPQRPRYDDNVEGPGCIEGPGLCTGQTRAASGLDQRVASALRSLDFEELTALAQSMGDHPRRSDVLRQIEIHQDIDAQRSALNKPELERLFFDMARHPRREEVRGLLRQAIYLDACRDLRRFGWPCPPQPGVDAVQATPTPVSRVQAPTSAPTPAPAPKAQTTFERLSQDIEPERLANASLPLDAVQNALAALNHYSGRVDGKFGPATARSIAAWREDVGSPGSARLPNNREVVVLLRQASIVSPQSRALLGLFKIQGIGFEQDVEAGKDMLRDAIIDGYDEARAWLEQLE